jgi:hypothetical protein
MSFGRQAGPPASAKQMDYLRSLVERARHTGFRDARGPLGLTQRQASGKFTKSEASALIDRLVNGADADGGGAADADQRYDSAAERLEAECRGWTVASPF